ncbi:Stf0 family sulfotransferase [Cribrihabitans sp. XS_ASV171]
MAGFPPEWDKHERVGKKPQAHGLGLFRQTLALFHPELAEDRSRITRTLGTTAFVYLSRADKSAQASSYNKPEQSGPWHGAPVGTELERLTLQGCEEAWADWLECEGIDPIRVIHAELSGGPLVILRAIPGRLGLYPGAAVVVPGVGQLANDVSRAWATRTGTKPVARPTWPEDGKARKTWKQIASFYMVESARP